MIDLSLLELYSESDLKDQMQKNIKLVKALAQQNKKLGETLRQMQNHERELAKFERDSKKEEELQRRTDKAERIEQIISDYMEKNWFSLSSEFPHVSRDYDPKLIHTSTRSYNAYIPRIIMIFFIARGSGMNKSQIADYFELDSHATVIHSVNVVGELSRRPLFGYHLEKLIDLLK